MSFMGRGNMPSINNNDLGDVGDNYQNNWGYKTWPNFGRWCYYIPLDNTYVIMQMIVTFIILIVGVIAFITTYESTIIDPIENIKNLFINTHLLIIGVLLGITFIINLFSKSKENLLKRLVIACILSILIMVVFGVIKLNLDTTYIESEFEKIYFEQNIDGMTSEKSRVEIGIIGVSMKTEREYYIDECMKLYNIFNMKSYATLGIHLMLNILLIYQIIKVQKIQDKQGKINKDDLILFDEEENVKF